MFLNARFIIKNLFRYQLKYSKDLLTHVTHKGHSGDLAVAGESGICVP